MNPEDLLKTIAGQGGAGADANLEIQQRAIQKILSTLKADEFLALIGQATAGQAGPAEGQMPAQPLTQGMAPHPQYTPPNGGGGMAGPQGAPGGDRAAKMKALFNMMGTGGAGPR